MVEARWLERSLRHSLLLQKLLHAEDQGALLDLARVRICDRLNVRHKGNELCLGTRDALDLVKALDLSHLLVKLG